MPTTAGIQASGLFAPYTECVRLLTALLPTAVLALGTASVPAAAQETATTVLQPENVRMDFAQVMRVQPIYQVLRATRMEPRCPEDDDNKGLAKIVGAAGLHRARMVAPATARCNGRGHGFSSRGGM